MSSNNENKSEIFFDLIDFHSFKKNVLNYINHLRTNPSSYAEFLEELMNKYFDNETQTLNYSEPMILKEGINCFIEAIDFLSNVNPLCPLNVKEGLVKSADDLIIKLAMNTGISKEYMYENVLMRIEQRLNKYGLALGKTFELIDIGTYDPQMIIVSFLLCDGDDTRRERNILFSPDINFIGISSDMMPDNKVTTVLSLCSDYYCYGDKIPFEIYQKNPEKFTNELL